MQIQKQQKQLLPSREILNNPLISSGKLPPQALDLEEVIIGACMLEAGAYDKIAHIISPDVFYKHVHQKIFNSICLLSVEKHPIDILTVTNHLKKTGELDECGGAYYITQLTNRLGSSAHIEFHSYVLYQKYVQREIIRAASELLKYAYEDFDQAMDAYGVSSALIDRLLAGKRSDKNMLQIMTDHAEEVQRRIDLYSKGIMSGISTGLKWLDKHTNGWKPNELIIIAARPSMGKTAVALNLFAKTAAEADKNVLFFSLEMDDISLADRLVCSYGGIRSDNLKKGDLSEAELLQYQIASTQLQKLPFSIDDTAEANIIHISAIARTKHRKGKCDMIIIDYLQLIEGTQIQNQFKNREREVAEMSRGLKLLAKELKIPIILLAQLSRAVESRGGDKRPMLSDLRESGAIEQDADMVIFPYRPEYYKIDQDDSGNSLEGVMILGIAKNRNGRTGDVFAKYSPDLTRFFDYDFQNTQSIF